MLARVRTQTLDSSGDAGEAGLARAPSGLLWSIVRRFMARVILLLTMLMIFFVSALEATVGVSVGVRYLPSGVSNQCSEARRDSLVFRSKLVLLWSTRTKVCSYLA